MNTDMQNTDADYRQKHTVCDAMLWDYLQGKLDAAEALFVSTHYHLSAEARKRVNELNACAAVSLEMLEPVAMNCSAEEFLKKCRAAVAIKKDEADDKTPSLPVPQPLQSYLGDCFEAVKWQTIMPGIQEKRIKLCDATSTAKVLKIDRGVKVPMHGHTGDEMTLVIHGLFEDDGETYKTGEVSYHADDSDELHAPQAVENCICLVVMSGTTRLPGLLGLLLNPIFRLRRL